MNAIGWIMALSLAAIVVVVALAILWNANKSVVLDIDERPWEKEQKPLDELQAAERSKFVATHSPMTDELGKVVYGPSKWKRMKENTNRS